ncbi:serine/threonine-protein kinase [Aquisphaera insulae]|uniref:serine/threonine-protein kinase n=1 Tax=Aquisphaera insulae TaxID=2712864 RepID=UPI0013EE2C82|nr:serine/threonine-protein kinase [Aquisphaera insulae]
MDMSTVHFRPDGSGDSSAGMPGVVRRFRDEWGASRSARPDLCAYLASVPPDQREVRLALLRTDMSLRWRTPEHRPPEWYRTRIADLDEDSLVTLMYEEFCLREDAGESPTADEFVARFPEVSAPFLDVMEVHRLVGNSSIFAAHGLGPTAPSFPEAGETIGGYRLVQELGRGAFGRVYLAEEKHLADRPVALKVTRCGSREPQTLARLQHTHIVPVYSYRSDRETGLHLLCMPFLGRTTLLRILADPAIGGVRSGRDLHGLLDRLEPSGADEAARAAVRRPLERRTYARTVASWVARLAEALQHAHDRGVLHHDIKPSNVLVTADGLPMLLDFNLAQERLPAGAAEGEGLGGTLAYMSPERLAILDGTGGHEGDHRSDIYSLGMVLLDCLARQPTPFSLPPSTATLREAVSHVSQVRLEGIPVPRDRDAEIPAALEAVVRKCLMLDPARRYASAADLAVDLRAVADDLPLRFAREPLPGRLAGSLRRRRYHLAVALVAAAALGFLGDRTLRARWRSWRMEAEVGRLRQEGRDLARRGDLDLAIGRFDSAARLAEEDPSTTARVAEIRTERELAAAAADARRKADRLFESGEAWRLALLGITGEAPGSFAAVRSALDAFSVLSDSDWTSRPEVGLLDADRRARLRREANDLLYIWAWSLARDGGGHPEGLRRAIEIVDRAAPFAEPAAPWIALRESCERKLRGPAEPPARPRDGPPGGEFQWALLCDLEGDLEGAAAWLERSIRRDPGDYWSQFYLGNYRGRLGQNDRALAHYQAAVALRPDSPWARYDLALMNHLRGDSRTALEDLRIVLADHRGARMVDARLELGLVLQSLGDEAGARTAYAEVIAADPGGSLARAARLNRAKIDADAGNLPLARSEYEALLNEDPRDVPARLSRALLAIRTGEAGLAEADLTVLLTLDPDRTAELLARRAVARIALGKVVAAEEDASSAFRRSPTPARERLWIRSLLAAGRGGELTWLQDPDELGIMPTSGRPLATDLRAALESLAALAERGSPTVSPAPIRRARAVILSRLDDPAAVAEADLAVGLLPDSPESHLVRSRVRLRAGRRAAAMEDVEKGLAELPGDSRFLTMRALLELDSGRASAALHDADRALALGARGGARRTRAEALRRLARLEESDRAWSEAVDEDPEDPRTYLGRAAARLELGRVDEAAADLDRAADWAGDHPTLLAEVVRDYARCVLRRPERRSRLMVLARRVVAAWRADVTPASSPRSRDRASK